MSHSAFFTFDIFYHSTLCPFRRFFTFVLMSFRCFVPIRCFVLSLSNSTFCTLTFFTFGVFNFDILSVNPLYNVHVLLLSWKVKSAWLGKDLLIVQYIYTLHIDTKGELRVTYKYDIWLVLWRILLLWCSGHLQRMSSATRFSSSSRFSTRLVLPSWPFIYCIHSYMYDFYIDISYFCCYL